MTALELPDGRVSELGERTAGGSKDETRFGRDLAGLVSVDTTGWPLARIGTSELVADHLERLRLLAPLLATCTRDAIGHAVEQIAQTERTPQAAIEVIERFLG